MQCLPRKESLVLVGATKFLKDVKILLMIFLKMKKNKRVLQTNNWIMKRIVSFKEFMTVIGLGIWQAICCVGRAFNYKNKTPFWRIIWGVLTACAVVFTCIFVYLFYDNEIKPKMNNEGSVLSLSDVIYSYIPDDSYSYSIWNRKTGKEIIK